MDREEAKNWLNKLYANADITDEYGDMVDMQPYSEAVDMAIEALEQEPCDHYTEGYFKGYDDGQKGKLEQESCEDAISRQAAIDCITYDEEYTVECLKALPPATPQSNMGWWIPVSERLPEAGKQYLCCNEDGFREVGYLSKVTGEWGFTDTEAFGEVIAWMPLPQPYKGESEETDADSN